MALFASRIHPQIQKEIRRRERANSGPSFDSVEPASFATRIPFIKLESNAVDAAGSNQVAHDNILYGGSVEFIRKYNDTRTGTTYKLLRESKEIGLRPLPGITSITVNNEGRLGSIRKATVNFHCWTLEDLELLQKIYMNPGVYLFLQWGYYERGMVPPPVISLFGKDATTVDKLTSSKFYPFSTESKYDENRYKGFIENQVIDNNGHYDALTGPCSNFSWKFNQDGGFDCSTTIISPSSFVYSFKFKDPDIRDNTFLLWVSSLLDKMTEGEKKSSITAFGGEEFASLKSFSNKLLSDPTKKMLTEKFFDNGDEYYKYIKLPTTIDGYTGDEYTYISFGHLCTLINNLFIYSDSGSASKLDFKNTLEKKLMTGNGYSKQEIATKTAHIDLDRYDAICKNHYFLRSFNPKEVLIFNGGADKNAPENVGGSAHIKAHLSVILNQVTPNFDPKILEFTTGDAQQLFALQPKNFSFGKIKNIYINIASVTRIMQSSTTIELVDFIDGVLDLINNSVDSFFKLIRDSDENNPKAIIIRDENLISRDIKSQIDSNESDNSAVFIFNNYTPRTVIKSITLDGNLPSKFQAAAYVANTSNNASQENAMQSIAFSKYAGGFRDANNKTHIGVSQQLYDGMLEDYYAVLNSQLYDLSTISFQKSFFTYLKLQAYSETWYDIETKKVVNQTPYPLGFPVGITMKLTLDGISGIYYGNVFGINYVPQFLKINNCFQVINVSHEVSAGGWTTVIDGLLRPMYGVTING